MEKKAHLHEKTAILAVSPKTSCDEAYRNAVGAVVAAVAKQFPGFGVREAFAGQMAEEALGRAVSDNIQTLAVQPICLMHGYGYRQLAAIVKKYEKKFHRLVLGEPLLSDDADFEAVVRAIAQKAAAYDDGKTAVCFMGHGSRASSGSVYAKMQDKLAEAGYRNDYIGTMGTGFASLPLAEGSTGQDGYIGTMGTGFASLPLAEGSTGQDGYIGTMKKGYSLEDIVGKLKENGSYEKVVLYPFMVMAGRHARYDMAGSQDGSWKRVLEQAGYEVTCVLEGLGQIPAVQELYVAHVRAAIALEL